MPCRKNMVIQRTRSQNLRLRRRTSEPYCYLLYSVNDDLEDNGGKVRSTTSPATDKYDIVVQAWK